jgi:nucleoside-diphosphate-sugar epimerase
MANMLIGFSGFVGGNLAKQFKYDYLINSKNINKAHDVSVDILTIAAGDARKWLANKEPEKDLIHIEKLFLDISKINAKKVILFSTVDVFSGEAGIYEDSELFSAEPYGRHRKYFEKLVLDHFNSVTIIRLPGLFGCGLKKNIIYDILHGKDLSSFNPDSAFQWFCLNDLSSIINYCSKHNISELNVSSEPISVLELCKILKVSPTLLNPNAKRINYDIRSYYSMKFNGTNDYLFSKKDVEISLLNYVSSMT